MAKRGDGFGRWTVRWLALPRLILLPLRLVFVALQPAVRVITEYEQRHHLYAHGTELFTSDDAPLTDRQRAALDLADAVIWQPSTIDAGLADRLRAHLTDAEIVEIVLDLVRNAANKFAVALGGDAAVVTDGVEFYDIDATGEVVADVDRELVRAATT